MVPEASDGNQAREDDIKAGRIMVTKKSELRYWVFWSDPDPGFPGRADSKKPDPKNMN